jgi:hypothetical protein
MSTLSRSAIGSVGTTHGKIVAHAPAPVSSRALKGRVLRQLRKINDILELSYGYSLPISEEDVSRIQSLMAPQGRSYSTEPSGTFNRRLYAALLQEAGGRIGKSVILRVQNIDKVSSYREALLREAYDDFCETIGMTLTDAGRNNAVNNAVRAARLIPSRESAPSIEYLLEVKLESYKAVLATLD